MLNRRLTALAASVHLLLIRFFGVAPEEAAHNIEKDHLIYGSAGMPRALSRLSAAENNFLQDFCGIRALEKGTYYCPALVWISRADYAKCYAEQKIPHQRLAGANEAIVGQFPWAVSLARGGHNICGGTLISDRHVLTSAHCFYKFRTNVPCTNGGFNTDLVQSMVVKYGGVCVRESRLFFDWQNCPEEDMQTVELSKVVIPIEFTEEFCSHGLDFAIVELKRRIEFSNVTRPICLRYIDKYDLRKNAKVYSRLENLGWGQEIEGRDGVARLRYFHGAQFVRIDDDEHSIRLFPPFPRSNVCKGDSGSSMIARHIASGRMVLIGIQSKAFPCSEYPVHEFFAEFLTPILPTVCHFTGVCAPLPHFSRDDEAQ